MTYRLPMPPSVNALYRNVPGRGRAKTKAYGKWLHAAGMALIQQVRVKRRGPVHIDISLPIDKRGRRDCDNHAKAVIDLLVAHQLIDDDRHVDSLFIAWEPVPDCTVRVVPFEERKARSA